MGKKTSLTVLGFNLVLAITASLVWTVPVLADGGTTTPPSSSSGSTRAVPSSNSAGSGLPGGTKVIILDSQGDKLPLGSQQAADILATGDPIWCPATLAIPTPGLSGCTTSAANLATLFATFTPLSPAMNGTIWIENTSDSSTPTLNGSGLAMSNFTLTLKGGWVGCSVPPCTSTISGTSTFNHPISITNWNNTVTLSDITINAAALTGLTVTTTKNIALTRVNSGTNSGGGASLDNCLWTGSACAGTGSVSVTSSTFDGNANVGLSVLSSGTITVTNVIAVGNTVGNGATLDNCESNGTICRIPTPKAVTVSGDGLYNSAASAYDNSFNGNALDGLEVISNGAVTLTDLTANGNTLYGAQADNSGSSAASAVTLNGMDIFNSNQETGLAVVSHGPISASHIYADSNIGSGIDNGASLDNSNAVTAQPVTISGTSQFNGNGDNGLTITTKGAIALTNITASFNDAGHTAGKQGNGALLQNNSVPAYKAPVTLSGTNSFNDNYGMITFTNSGGLVVYTDGPVKLSNLTANGNSGASLAENGWGALIQNQGSLAPQAVTLTGQNFFNNNQADGLQVYASGNATAASVTANSNGQVGAYFSAATVSLTSASLGGNAYEGLYAVANTSFKASNLAVVGDGDSTLGDGAYITAATVTLSGNNLFDSNYHNGLTIIATGALTANGLTATNNGLTGASGIGVDITGSSAAIKITGTNTFNGNYSGGLYVNANGAITANSLTADCNGYSSNCTGATGGYGVSLNNSTASTPGVTLTGANEFSNNNSYGLTINTYGKIAASALKAVGNTTDGVDLYNNSNPTPTPETVTLTGPSTFGDNGARGLVVNSLGAITLNNLTAYVSPGAASTGNSVSLSNAFTGAVGGVTLTGTNSFNDYQASASNQDGLQVQSYGVVSLNNVTANGNGGYGVSVDNSTATLAQAVKLTGANTFNANTSTGLLITSKGAISANNLQAGNSAAGGGADLINIAGAATATVTLTGASSFNNNHVNGLYIQSSGAVTTNNLTADCNGYSGACVTGVAGIGVWIDNTNLGTAQKVSMLGTNTFNSNDGAGLKIASDGAISVASLSANSSLTGNGALLDNSTAPSAQAVSLAGSNTFDGNQLTGLYVASLGAITVNNLDAESNHSGGANLDNSAGSAASVTLTGMNTVLNNQSDGLDINSSGAVALTKLYSDNSASGDGLHVAEAASVSITCGGFTGNAGAGVFVHMTAVGTVTLSGVVSTLNTGPDVSLTGAAAYGAVVRDCPLP